ncbi:MAG: VCBS repeat-containing protein [Planctomycetes bacterium]|nr:VCBS repeat-containing protein [Planctomycetota bacterium]
MSALLHAFQELARIQTLELEAGRRADVATLADLDGDGTREVLLAVHEPGKDFARHLETWRLGADGRLARAESLALTRDVVAFAHADVLEGGGEELVLFNAGGVFAWRSAPEARPERLLACEFLWQAPDPELAFHWEQGVRDIDGDGLADLILPEPGGFAIARQRRPRSAESPWGEVSRVRVPAGPKAGVWDATASPRQGLEGQRAGGRFQIGFRMGERDGEAGGGALVAVHEELPAPFWLDWDADGDLDLLVQTERHLQVWLQDASGFPAAPQHSLELPVPADESRVLDASYSAHAVDLDLDRRADCVIFAGDKRSDDVRTQGLFFTQAAVREGPALFGPEGRPASLLVFAGFVFDPRFRDLDADGYPELVLRTVRPDLIDQIRSASTETIDADLYVYRNRGGVLARQPDLARSHAIALAEFELSAEFFGDVSGDGLADLLVRDEPEKLRVLMLRAQGPRAKSSWTLVEKPLWELSVTADARVQLAVPSQAERVGLFVLEPAQVLWVRFR